MLKLIVYTALIGRYDSLCNAPSSYAGCEFVCFTDRTDLGGKGWDIRPIRLKFSDAVTTNRYYKMFPHRVLPPCDVSLYVDSNVVFGRNPVELIDLYMGSSPIMVPKHTRRDCLYKEAETLVGAGRVDASLVRKQLDKYELEGFPRGFGLGEMNIIFRRHGAQDLDKLMALWWGAFQDGVKRDQLSFCYCVWKLGTDVVFMSENPRPYSPYFFCKAHSSSSFLLKLKNWVARCIWHFK